MCCFEQSKESRFSTLNLGAVLVVIFENHAGWG